VDSNARLSHQASAAAPAAVLAHPLVLKGASCFTDTVSRVQPRHPIRRRLPLAAAAGRAEYETAPTRGAKPCRQPRDRSSSFARAAAKRACAVKAVGNLHLSAAALLPHSRGTTPRRPPGSSSSPLPLRALGGGEHQTLPPPALLMVCGKVGSPRGPDRVEARWPTHHRAHRDGPDPDEWRLRSVRSIRTRGTSRPARRRHPAAAPERSRHRRTVRDLLRLRPRAHRFPARPSGSPGGLPCVRRHTDDHRCATGSANGPRAARQWSPSTHVSPPPPRDICPPGR
jgi:hypothetical protein